MIYPAEFLPACANKGGNILWGNEHFLTVFIVPSTQQSRLSLVIHFTVQLTVKPDTVAPKQESAAHRQHIKANFHYVGLKTDVFTEKERIMLLNCLF